MWFGPVGSALLSSFVSLAGAAPAAAAGRPRFSARLTGAQCPEQLQKQIVLAGTFVGDPSGLRFVAAQKFDTNSLLIRR